MQMLGIDSMNFAYYRQKWNKNVFLSVKVCDSLSIFLSSKALAIPFNNMFFWFINLFLFFILQV